MLYINIFSYKTIEKTTFHILLKGVKLLGTKHGFKITNSFTTRTKSIDHVVNIYFQLLLGYFTHVTTLAEVKEQVLKYIPVMARPMVMFREKHPIHWTGVYADIEVSKCKTLCLPGDIYVHINLEPSISFLF